jgi:hypothetical protein
MKLAQRQQSEVSDGKWGSVRGRARQAPHAAEPPGVVQADPVHAASREDDPYRGKSDGEILQRCEL